MKLNSRSMWCINKDHLDCPYNLAEFCKCNCHRVMSRATAQRIKKREATGPVLSK